MLKTLDRYEHIIIKYRIEKFEQFGANLRFRTEILLKNKSKLFVREMVIEGKVRKYSYHWQDEKGNLIIRWDNAPDWDVETFPHHKHLSDKIESSYERTMEQVLRFIDKKLKKSSKQNA